MDKAILEFYRCPENLIKLSLAGEPSPEPGYFRFGQDTVCYGRSYLESPSKPVRNGLRDLSPNVTWDGAKLLLPFDPSQIIDNLRCERYAAGGHVGKRSVLPSATLQKVYYALRPLLGVSVRKHLQKVFLRNWDKLQFPSWPVDTTVEHLLERLLFLSMKAQKIEKVPFIWFWPEGWASCAVVTHDVETKVGVELTSRLMDVDDAFGIKASFQIIPQGPYPVSTGYLEGIRRRGFEVNVQDLAHDGNLFDNRKEFLFQAQSINRFLREYGAEGFRAGRLYRNADWYEALEASYDMSIPNVGHLEAQRGGCCTVFPYFIGRILELPLTTIQDYSLFHILGDFSIDLWKKQANLVMAKHGLVSFIIHPDYSMEDTALSVYKSLLGYLVELRDARKLWIALPQAVNRWWRERSEMRLVCEDGKWRIQGKGNERAKVAYAKLAGDDIHYTFNPAA
jgi:hypothetical protein